MPRPAHSVNVARDEANAMAPGRSTASDGWIGDPAHASRASRHNPNQAGVVCARDITDDPAAGFPVHTVLRWLVTNVLAPLAGQGYTQKTAPEPWNNVAYFISADQTAGWSTLWRWKPYKGSNRHLKHGHIGVGIGPDAKPKPPYDSPVAWGLARATDPDDQELTMADISQILAGLTAIEAKVNALAAALGAMASNGAYDYTPVGGDLNSLAIEDGRLVQRCYENHLTGWREPAVLMAGMVPGSLVGPLVRGRRLDAFAADDAGIVWCFTFDPDDGTPGDLPGGWSAVALDPVP